MRPIADIVDGGFSQPVAQLLQVQACGRDRVAERFELAVSLPPAGLTSDRPVSRIWRARHAMRVTDAVPEHVVGTVPSVAGAGISTVVDADDFVPADALVPDLVEERSRRPALMRAELRVRLHGAVVEEHIRSRRVGAGDIVMPSVRDIERITRTNDARPIANGYRRPPVTSDLGSSDALSCIVTYLLLPPTDERFPARRIER